MSTYVKTEGSKRRKLAGKPKKKKSKVKTPGKKRKSRVKTEPGKKTKKARVKKEPGKTKKEIKKEKAQEDKRNYELFTSIVRSKSEITELDLRQAFEEHRVDSESMRAFITKLERLWMRIAFIPHRYPRTFRIRPHAVAAKLKKLNDVQRAVFCAVEAATDPEAGVHRKSVKWHLGLEDKVVKHAVDLLMVNGLIIKAPLRRVGTRAAMSAAYQIAQIKGHTAFFTSDGLLDTDLFERMYDKSLSAIQHTDPRQMDYKEFSKFLLEAHDIFPNYNLKKTAEVFLARKIDGPTLCANLSQNGNNRFWAKVGPNNRERSKKGVERALLRAAEVDKGMAIEDLHEYLVGGLGDRTRKPIPIDDIQKVAKILEYDGLAEVEEGRVKVRRWHPSENVMNAFVSIPCGTCPVSLQCSEHGKINPRECEFLQNWLSF